MFRSVAWLALLLAAPAGAQSVAFRVATTQPLTSEPSAMAVADLNNDQQLDIVVANFIDATVSIYLTGSDGTLTSIGDFPAGGAGRGILIRDFDGDGIPDILLSEDESDYLHLLHGLGDGTFGDPTQINSAHDPVRIAADDLDGDGILDLAVTLSASGEGDGRVSISRGLGGGAFDTPQIISLDVGSEGVVIEDFDGDGAPDVAVANNGPGTVSILRNLGHLTFAAPVSLTAGAGAGPLVLGDVDEDGRPDLIAANTGDSTVAVLRSRGDGTFDPVVTFPSGGILLSDLAAVDVNGDGHVDLIVSAQRSQSVSVLLGVGDGSFDLPRGFVADVEPIAVAVLDLNGDGALDLLSANRGSTPPSLALLFGDGSGRFEGVQQLNAAGAAGVAVADFNEDAVADAALALPASSGVTVFFGAGSTTANVATDRAAVAMVTADLDGDDHFDLVMATTAPDISVFFGRGDGTFAPPIHIPLSTAAAALEVADFDHDGAPDLVAISAGPPARLTLLSNTHERSFSPSATLPLDAQPLSLAVADFDGDGKPDVAIGAIGGVLILRGDGANAFAPPSSVATGVPALAMAVSDVDGDGDLDLVIAESSQGQGHVRVLSNDGHGAFTVGSARFAGQLPIALAVRDFDGNGVPELLVADRITDSVGLMTSHGQGKFQLDLSILSSVRPNGVASGDFEGDGAYDVVTSGATVCRLVNAGTPHRLPGDGNGDGRVSAADLVALARELADGDGISVDDVGWGAFAGAPGVDADGDGRVTRSDARAIIRRLMNRVAPAPVVP